MLVVALVARARRRARQPVRPDLPVAGLPPGRGRRLRPASGWFPTFNVADSAITIGVILLVVVGCAAPSRESRDVRGERRARRCPAALGGRAGRPGASRCSPGWSRAEVAAPRRGRRRARRRAARRQEPPARRGRGRSSSSPSRRCRAPPGPEPVAGRRRLRRRRPRRSSPSRPGSSCTRARATPTARSSTGCSPASPRSPASATRRGPGIVHRLDRDTSGLLVVARTQRGLRRAGRRAGARRAIERGYLALVWGALDAPRGVDRRADRPVARRAAPAWRCASQGREARTGYEVRAAFDDADGEPARVPARDRPHAPDPGAPRARSGTRWWATARTAAAARRSRSTARSSTPTRLALDHPVTGAAGGGRRPAAADDLAAVLAVAGGGAPG